MPAPRLSRAREHATHREHRWRIPDERNESNEQVRYFVCSRYALSEGWFLGGRRVRARAVRWRGDRSWTPAKCRTFGPEILPARGAAECCFRAQAALAHLWPFRDRASPSVAPQLRRRVGRPGLECRVCRIDRPVRVRLLVPFEGSDESQDQPTVELYERCSRARRWRVNQSIARRATSSSAPGSSNRCVAPGTIESSHQA